MSILKPDNPQLMIGIYVVSYFAFLGLTDGEGLFFLAGADLYQISAPALASYWLIRSYVKEKKGRVWLLFGVGMISYLIGMLVWGFTEVILGQTVPFPGLPDLFWMFTYLFFFIAILYKVCESKTAFSAVQFLFDLFLVMITAVMFSYKFIIGPIIEAFHSESLLFKIVYISYPVGDLAIFLGAVMLYLSSNTLMNKQTLSLLIAGLFTYFAADTAYVYMVVKEIYSTGNLLDPIFSLALLLIGSASLSSEKDEVKRKTHAGYGMNIRFLIPYISFFLFILLMVFYQNDHIVIYSAILVMVVIILRFIFVILENKVLVKELEHNNASLEQKIHERTKELEQSRQRYHSLYEYHPDYVFSLDLNGNIMTLNKAFKERAGKKEKEIIGSSFLPLLRQEDRNAAFQKYLNAVQGTPQDYEVTAADGQILQITNIPMVLNHEVIGVYGIGRNITEQKRALQQIDFLANHDELTGLANRRMIEKEISNLINFGEKAPFYLLMIDLDGFKEINDRFGHDVGDSFLQLAGKRLKSSVRESDLVARLGGDEFMILMKEMEGPLAVELKAKQILADLNEHFEIAGQKLFVSCSIGISSYPENGSELRELMKYADVAMYTVKQNGKNDVFFFAKTS